MTGFIIGFASATLITVGLVVVIRADEHTPTWTAMVAVTMVLIGIDMRIQNGVTWGWW